MRRLVTLLVGGLLVSAAPCFAQVTGGQILGVVEDASSAAVPNARVTVRNLETNAEGHVLTSEDGRFRFPQLPVGPYEATAEKAGFAKHVQGPIVLRLNQEAQLEIKLQVAGVNEVVTVTADAPLINTANAEVGVNFDRRRVSELPLGAGRNILNLALSVAGVSQLQSNQVSLARSGVDPSGGRGNFSFSVNGMRLRSNNFMIDGQDSNEAIVTGLLQPINNPDAVAEFRLLTSQFAPEYGRAAGSVVNIITKSGTSQFHGSAFWFHNDQHFNSRNNLDKQVFPSAPFRLDNQFGGTLGGPLVKDKTFFFGSLQRWTDRRLGAGTTIRGVPTEEGRSLLNAVAGERQTVKMLLRHLPAAQAPVAGLSAPLTVAGQTAAVPLGTLTGFSNIRFNDWQWSARLDHRLNQKHALGGRALFDDAINSGGGQVTPPGLTTVDPQRALSASVFLNSTPSYRLFHELRLSYGRLSASSTAASPDAEGIPSIEVPQLGLRGFNPAPTRTAIGMNVVSPTSGFGGHYQIQETVGIYRGPHSMKFGLDFRKQDVSWFFFRSIRGRLVYNALQDLVDDAAQTALISSPLPGGEPTMYFKYYDYFFFLQDEWRLRPDFTVTYGVRYESPGDSFAQLVKVNQRIVAAAGGDQRFALTPVPKRDTNNWAPRFGFNWRVPAAPGVLGWVTSDAKLVLRGGYSRTYDFAFANLAANVGSDFPFRKTDSLLPRTPHSLEALRRASAAPVANPSELTRTAVSGDFRSPYAEQFALQVQRELRPDWALSLGWVATKGTALFQTIDGNPTVPGSRPPRRVDPTRGVIRGHCNCASSIYHSFQTGLEKRLSKNLALAAHYTWSAFIDGASETHNPSASGEVAVSQDSFNRRADRGRASYDRPQRLAVNGVYELPFHSQQEGIGKLLGGWQISGFLTFQSGAPFTALNGDDPGFRLSGIDSQVGNAIRANANTNLDLARMPVEEMVRAGGARLFSRVTVDSPLASLGRNILRADGIANLDLGLLKSTRLREGHTLQFRVEFYNATNTRNFGIPDASVNSANFLNQWGQDGGNRRVVLALRYVF